ncbi:MAG: DEAD/DEAH box helicase [Bacteroidales bacterium]|nr:DEAD/DEAH box helicase [Bacteroidales bacterium]
MTTFEELGLKPELLKIIDELGFVNPTPIQDKIIPVILDSRKDLIGLAQTGTGKTAAFGLPIIQQSDNTSREVQSLVLCPTRELCMQVANDLKTYSKYVKQFNVLSVYGGASIEPQIKAIKRGCQIVVGTPGRTLDLIKRKVLKIKNIRWLVLDEADEMLNMGFKDELDAILEQTPKEKETLLFSATMPKEIRQIAEKYMNEPEEILAGKKNIGAENVRHEFYSVQAKDRYEVLKRIADINPKIYSIVFCRTRRETKEVADKLIADGYNADALHGDLSQPQRDSVMKRFRTKHLQILVATDVAARGLDVNDLTHIINYNLPDELEIYIHRSGRTGRAGKSGISIAICHSREVNKIKRLEQLTGKKFVKKLVPGGKEICEKQLFNLIDKVEKIEVNDAQIEQYLPVIYKKLDWLSREDLIKHFVSVEFNRFLAYYKGARDLNVSSKPPRDEIRKGKAKGFSRFFISVGSKSNLTVPRLIGLINDSTQKRNIEIGKIDIMKKFSFFEIDSKYEKEILEAFKNAKYEGGKVSVELSKPDTKSTNKRESSDNDFRNRKSKKRFAGRKKGKRY